MPLGIKFIIGFWILAAVTVAGFFVFQTIESEQQKGAAEERKHNVEKYAEYKTKFETFVNSGITRWEEESPIFEQVPNVVREKVGEMGDPTETFGAIKEGALQIFDKLPTPEWLESNDLTEDQIVKLSVHWMEFNGLIHTLQQKLTVIEKIIPLDPRIVNALIQFTEAEYCLHRLLTTLKALSPDYE